VGAAGGTGAASRLIHERVDASPHCTSSRPQAGAARQENGQGDGEAVQELPAKIVGRAGSSLRGVLSATNGRQFSDGCASRGCGPRGASKEPIPAPFRAFGGGTRGVPLIRVICAPPLFHSSSRLAGRRSPRHARGGGGGNRMPAPRLAPCGVVRSLSAARRGWTTAVAALIAGLELWRTVLQSGGWVSVQLSAMAVALALIGPGVWSIDARFLGWRRINIPPPRQREGSSPPG
jgi:hypothetical protein